jgi:hypothetical protein
MMDDESWFYFNIDHEYMWIFEWAKISIWPNRIIANPKQMLIIIIIIIIIFRLSFGFSLIEILRKWSHFDA